LDFHHYLVDSLNYDQLKIAWMMTQDDGGNDGKTQPELFPARPEIIDFCHQLKKTRNPGLLLSLPDTTGAKYYVSFHDTEDSKKGNYFSSVEPEPNQLIFLDPDNGFEPEQSYTNKHVRYSDIEILLNKSSHSTVISVFQHHRRKKFTDDFSRIRERLISGYSTAIYWHPLMFVCVSTSESTINKVREFNQLYEHHYPVKVIT
jgi:hypothetical protein